MIVFMILEEWRKALRETGNEMPWGLLTWGGKEPR